MSADDDVLAVACGTGGRPTVSPSCRADRPTSTSRCWGTTSRSSPTACTPLSARGDRGVARRARDHRLYGGRPTVERARVQVASPRCGAGLGRERQLGPWCRPGSCRAGPADDCHEAALAACRSLAAVAQDLINQLRRGRPGLLPSAGKSYEPVQPTRCRWPTSGPRWWPSDSHSPRAAVYPMWIQVATDGTPLLSTRKSR